MGGTWDPSGVFSSGAGGSLGDVTLRGRAFELAVGHHGGGHARGHVRTTSIPTIPGGVARSIVPGRGFHAAKRARLIRSVTTAANLRLA
jgi:hypothetical protein